MNMDYCKPPKAFPSRSENHGKSPPATQQTCCLGRQGPWDPGTLRCCSKRGPGASPTGWGPQAPKIAKLPYKWFNYGYTMDYGRYM